VRVIAGLPYRKQSRSLSRTVITIGILGDSLSLFVAFTVYIQQPIILKNLKIGDTAHFPCTWLLSVSLLPHATNWLLACGFLMELPPHKSCH